MGADGASATFLAHGASIWALDSGTYVLCRVVGHFVGCGCVVRLWGSPWVIVMLNWVLDAVLDYLGVSDH